MAGAMKGIHIPNTAGEILPSRPLSGLSRSLRDNQQLGCYQIDKDDNQLSSEFPANSASVV